MGWLICILAVFVICFLLGSIPWGVVISRLFFHKDIRNEGSGNIGTTNAMRTMGKKAGAAVFLLDFGKGLLAGFVPQCVLWFFVFLGGTLDFSVLSYSVLAAVSFLACIWGHVFSPWLGFKGGKGIAVAVGNLFFFFGPAGALIEIAIFAVLVIATRYVSLGSVAAAIACPFVAFACIGGNPVTMAITVVAALTVIWAHRGNISRLIAGNERRIGDKKKA